MWGKINPQEEINTEKTGSSVPSKGAGKRGKPTLRKAETSALETQKPLSTTVAMEKENRLSILYLYVEMVMESIKARERLELENFSNESEDDEQKTKEAPKKKEDFKFELNIAQASTEPPATAAEPAAIVELGRIESPEVIKVQTDSIAINTEEFSTKPTTSEEPMPF